MRGLVCTPSPLGLHRSHVLAGHTPKTCVASTFSPQALQPAGFSASRKPRAYRGHARSSPRPHPARLRGAYTLSPRHKRIFVASIATRRLQCEQETARTSHHARSSSHSHPTRLRSACTRNPHLQAHFRRRHRSPQASAQAGNRAHVASRAFIAAFSLRASSVAHAHEARTASAFSSQALQPAGFNKSRKPRICYVMCVHRRALAPRVSVAHAHEARTAFPPQRHAKTAQPESASASASAGSGFIASFLPRASP